MGIQNKILTQKLWETKKYRSISIRSNDKNLSSEGHGIFIESLSGDIYADLRLCSLKPFWGHTHPIALNLFYGNSPTNTLENYSYKSYLDNDLINYFKQSYNSHKTINFTDNFNFKESDLLTIIIDESFLILSDEQIQNKVKVINEKNSGCKIHIFEKNLLGLNPSELSFATTYNISFDYLQVHCLPGSRSSLTKASTQLKVDYSPDAGFYSQLIDFYQLALNPLKHSKIKLNSQTLNEFITTNSLDWVIKHNYIQINCNLPQDIIESFMKNGLVITSDNFISGTLYLSITSACTKHELLDILKSIKEALKG